MGFKRPVKDRAPAKGKTLNLRLSLDEWEDVRKCAIAEDETLVGVVRMLIAERKAKLIKAGKWPEISER